MEIYRTFESLISFPPFPSSIARKYEISDLALRPFGTEEGDLGIDFSRKDLPNFVTDILKHCSVSKNDLLTKDFFRELSVGKRIECLLILAAGGNRAVFSFPFECDSCALTVELELSLGEIGEIQRESDLHENVEIEIDNQALVFRKPSGLDQETWLDQRFSGKETAKQIMLSSLQIKPKAKKELSSETLAVIEESMDEADPLINFFFRARCSECDTQSDLPIDLCEFALSELNRAQKMLIWTTHRLASHYHWSEKEIFAVPHSRRMRYLELIADKK